MEQNMFCYQCQETAGCSGCTKSGVCGKRPETAALQDLLIWTTKGLSAVTTQLRREGKNRRCQRQSSHHRKPVYDHHKREL